MQCVYLIHNYRNDDNKYLQVFFICRVEIIVLKTDVAIAQEHQSSFQKKEKEKAVLDLFFSFSIICVLV